MLREQNRVKPTAPPMTEVFDGFMNKLSEENFSEMLPWLAEISDSLTALESIVEKNNIPTSKAIEFYYHTDDILSISRSFKYKNKTYNLVPHAKNLIQKL